MPRKSPVSVFIAAASVLIASGSAQMGNAQGAGGLKEWNTDQGIDEKSTITTSKPKRIIPLNAATL